MGLKDNGKGRLRRGEKGHIRTIWCVRIVGQFCKIKREEGERKRAKMS